MHLLCRMVSTVVMVALLTGCVPGDDPPPADPLTPADQAPEHDPEKLIERARTQLIAFEDRHAVLRGISADKPKIERDAEGRLKTAQFVFKRNATPSGKSVEARDRSMPFLHVSVAVWSPAGQSQQPPAYLYAFRWKGQTYNMWARVFASDRDLLGKLKAAVDPWRAEPAEKAPANPCKVTGTLTSTEYARAGGTLDRAIAYAVTDPGRKRVGYSNAKGSAIAFDLPPGNYIVECTGIGSRGATFVPTDRKLTVKEGTTKIDLGTIDLPASKITKLFDRPAPDLSAAIAWKHTEPLTMKELKGKVVVLDFWSYSCSICLAHKPDLVKLRDNHRGKGLAVLTIHDSTAATMAEVDQKVPDAVKRKAADLPVALDCKGNKGIFASYGIYAVPTVILIDQDGKVVRRFHHAGDPELSAAVGRLLGTTR